MTPAGNRLLAVRLPIPWPDLGISDPADLSGTIVVGGEAGWRWEEATPDLGIAEIGVHEAHPMAGWGVDHAVLLTPDVESAVSTLTAAGADLRLRTAVRGRPTAFFRAGTILEVIEEGVDSPRLYGVALTVEEPLEAVVLRWRSAGFDVGDPHPAIQASRRIFSVKLRRVGLAVMSPEPSAPPPSSGSSRRPQAGG